MRSWSPIFLSSFMRLVMTKISIWFWRFSSIGCGPFDVTDNAKSIRLLNQLSLLVLLSDLATIGHYVRFGMHAQIWAVVGLICCLILTIYLNHLRHYQMARYLFLGCANFGLAFFSLTMGLETGVHLLYFVTPLVVYLLSPQSDRMTRILWIIIPVTAMFVVLTQRDWLQSYLPVAHFPAEELKFQMLQATSWAYIFILAVAWNFDRVTTARARKLAFSLEKQSVAYGLVVHDAASYLSNISTSLYLLRRGDLQASEEQKVAEVLDDQVARLGKLMNTLRQHLKTPQSDETNSEQAANLGSAFAEAMDLLALRGSRSERGVYLISSDAAATFVTLAHSDLVQIIDNFAVNASTAIERAGGVSPVLVVEAEKIETDAHAYIRIKITDNGPGLSNHNFEKLFLEPEDNANARQKRSMGLRLIAHYIKLAGGKLSCVSPAAGSEFMRVSVDPKVWGNMPGTTITIDLPLDVAWIGRSKATDLRQAA